ncbi:helix-turn-helix domain-containing protein [Sphingomonas sp. R647]|uniref:helix-turn-helix domain-containing protein n=1 Tax=Sphingomonas sp. R647 TaxID=2875233 RepID=UPI0039905260
MAKVQSERIADMEPLTVRIAEACRITGIGRSKLYELIAAGEIETIKVGAITLIPLNGIRALVDRGRSVEDSAFSRRLEAAMHSTLARGIMTAALTNLPQGIRSDLSSLHEQTRVKAEDAIVACIVKALYASEL